MESEFVYASNYCSLLSDKWKSQVIYKQKKSKIKGIVPIPVVSSTSHLIVEEQSSFFDANELAGVNTKRVEVSAVEFDWIFNENEGVAFLQ
jgi:hypothetical protein